MMRAGKLDRRITLERRIEALDEYGVPSEAWTSFATIRAELITASTEEFLRAYGTAAETATVFRIRHLDGITTADRIAYEGQLYDLKAVSEIGRRRGLELRAVAKAQ